MKIQASKRDVLGKKVKSLRSQDIVPASVFGPKRASTPIQFEKKSFLKTFKEAGFSKFIDLEIDGESKSSKVLVKEIQKHPVKDTLISVSFFQVDEDTKITVEVPVILEGESPAVKQNLGFLVNSMDAIAVHCLPKDLPKDITIDISKLENVGDAVTVADITLPEGAEWDSSIDATSAIVYIAGAQKEEVEEKPVVAEGEEGATAEGAEGATPAAEAKE